MMEAGNLKSRAALKRNTKELKICEQGAVLSFQGCLGQLQKQFFINSLQILCAGNVGKNKNLSTFALEMKREGQILPACLGDPTKLGLSF